MFLDKHSNTASVFGRSAPCATMRSAVRLSTPLSHRQRLSHDQPPRKTSLHDSFPIQTAFEPTCRNLTCIGTGLLAHRKRNTLCQFQGFLAQLSQIPVEGEPKLLTGRVFRTLTLMRNPPNRTACTTCQYAG